MKPSRFISAAALLVVLFSSSALAAPSERSELPTRSADLHVFVENGVLFAQTGQSVLDLHLVSGELNLYQGKRLVHSTTVHLPLSVPDVLAGEGVTWIGSELASDRKQRAVRSEGDIDLVGGSWLLTYEHLRWKSKQDALREEVGGDDHSISSMCGGELASLMQAVIAVEAACTGPGTTDAGCGAAVASLVSAFGNFVRCFEQER